MGRCVNCREFLGEEVFGIKNFVKDKSNWISIITVLIAVIGFGISFIINEFNNKIISFMFIMIAVENLFIQVNYLEHIKNKIQRNKETIKLQKHCKTIMEILDNTQGTLIITGFNLISWSGVFRELVEKASKGVHIKILITDISIQNLVKTYEDMRGHSTIVSSISHLDFLKNRNNIEIRVIQSILPTSFVAYDMDTSNGYIKAQHIINNHTSMDYPNVELFIGDPWFDNYKCFIEDNWGRGLPIGLISPDSR